jgi:hypothetical protein
VGRELRRLLMLVESGQVSHEHVPTVEEWLSTYFRVVAPGRVRLATLRSYEDLARLHIIPWLGKHRIDRLRPQHLSACYRELALTLSSGSVRRVHAVLRRALTVAVRWGFMTTTPV